MTTSPRHESPELGAMIGRMMNALIRRASEGDTEALEALARVEALAPAATTAALIGARVDFGYSLGELAAVTGTSRQALSQRTGRAEAPAVDLAGCGHHGCVGVRRCRNR